MLYVCPGNMSTRSRDPTRGPAQAGSTLLRVPPSTRMGSMVNVCPGTMTPGSRLRTGLTTGALWKCQPTPWPTKLGTTAKRCRSLSSWITCGHRLEQIHGPRSWAPPQSAAGRSAPGSPAGTGSSRFTAHAAGRHRKALPVAQLLDHLRAQARADSRPTQLGATAKRCRSLSSWITCGHRLEQIHGPRSWAPPQSAAGRSAPGSPAGTGSSRFTAHAAGRHRKALPVAQLLDHLRAQARADSRPTQLGATAKRCRSLSSWITCGHRLEQIHGPRSWAPPQSAAGRSAPGSPAGTGSSRFTAHAAGRHRKALPVAQLLDHLRAQARADSRPTQLGATAKRCRSLSSWITCGHRLEQIHGPRSWAPPQSAAGRSAPGSPAGTGSSRFTAHAAGRHRKALPVAQLLDHLHAQTRLSFNAPACIAADLHA